VEKFEVGIEKKKNYDAIETLSRNLGVSQKSSTWSTSDSRPPKPSTHTTSQLVQPLLQGSLVSQTDRKAALRSR